MAGQMWFGNTEKMQWVPCPAVDMTAGQRHWVGTSQYLNGGTGLRRSATGSMVYEMEWNLTSERELDKIQSYVEGVWGEGPYYFLDPQAMRTNVFPAAFAQPRVALRDGPKLLFDVAPTATVSTPVGGGPGVGAQYIRSGLDQSLLCVIPIPPGHKLTFHCEQDQTTAAFMAYAVDGDGPTGRAEDGEIVAGDEGSFVIFFLGGEGPARVYWMWGVITPEDETPVFDGFVSGKGSTAVDFEEFTRNVYSAALDKVGASATLVEVQAWQ